MRTTLELVRAFLLELRGKGRKPATVATAAWAVEDFCRWVDSLGGCPPAAVSRVHVKAYLYGGVINGQEVVGTSQRTTRRGTPMSAASFNQRQRYLAQFFRWCAAEDYMHAGLELVCEAITVATQTQPRITVAQMWDVFNKATDPLHRIFMSTAFHTIGRASEFKLVQLKHVDMNEGTINWYNEKKGRPDLKAISPRFAGHLKEWLDYYGAHAKIVNGKRLASGPLDPEWYLIPRRYVNPHKGYALLKPDKPYESLELITHQHLDRLFSDTTGVGCHVWRRSGARAMFDHLSKNGYGAALRYISGQLDHGSTRTTEVYLGLDVDKEAMRDLIREGGVDFFAQFEQDATVIPMRGRR